jgi:hypothetical protein
MQTRSIALAILAIVGVIGIAAKSEAFSTVFVTDEAGMRALADSDSRASIRGKVSSISTKYYGDHRHDVYLHFEGVQDDRVIAFIAPDAFEDDYGVNLERLVGKTVEITSRARMESSGQIVFSAIDWSQFKVLDSGSGSPTVATESQEQPEFTPSATADDRHKVQLLNAQAEADSLPALEKLGLAYFFGTLGLKQDYSKSADYFDKALTHSGHCDRPGPCPTHSLIAQVYMAKQLQYGLGVKQSLSQADAHYLEAIRISGNPELNKQLWKEHLALAKPIAEEDQWVKKEIARRQAIADEKAREPDSEVVRVVTNFVAALPIPVETDCDGFGHCVEWVRSATPEEEAALRGPQGQQFIKGLVEELTSR